MDKMILRGFLNFCFLCKMVSQCICKVEFWALLLSLDEVSLRRGLIDHILVPLGRVFTLVLHVCTASNRARSRSQSMSATWLVGQNFNWAKRKCYSTTKKISPLGGAGKKNHLVGRRKEVQQQFIFGIQPDAKLKILASADLLYKSDLPQYLMMDRVMQRFKIILHVFKPKKIHFKQFIENS